jgi:hypothetical protein
MNKRRSRQFRQERRLFLLQNPQNSKTFLRHVERIGNVPSKRTQGLPPDEQHSSTAMTARRAFCCDPFLGRVCHYLRPFSKFLSLSVNPATTNYDHD